MFAGKGLWSLRGMNFGPFTTSQYWSAGYAEAVERLEQINRALGRAIARHRGEMTQQEVWTRVGMTRSTYRRWEQGDFKSVNLDELWVIADFLKTDPETLMAEARAEVLNGQQAKSNPAADTFGSALGF